MSTQQKPPQFIHGQPSVGLSFQKELVIDLLPVVVAPAQGLAARCSRSAMNVRSPFSNWRISAYWFRASPPDSASPTSLIIFSVNYLNFFMLNYQGLESDLPNFAIHTRNSVPIGLILIPSAVRSIRSLSIK